METEKKEKRPTNQSSVPVDLNNSDMNTIKVEGKKIHDITESSELAQSHDLLCQNDDLDIDIDEHAGKPDFERCYARIISTLTKSNRIGEVEAEFRLQQTDQDRFRFMINLDVVQDCIDISKKVTKNFTEAVTRRETGNSMFRKRYYADAHELYTQSIQLFPAAGLDQEGKEELAKSYANRATMSVHMNEYKAALVDITRAFDLGYPDHLKHKLYEKQAKCFKHLKEYDNAATALKSAIESVVFGAKDSLSSEKKVNLLDDMRKQQVNCQRLAKNSDAEPKVDKPVQIPQMSKDYSQQLTSASKLVDIVYSEEQGRHAVARDSISVGDIIVVEKPFGSVLVPAYYDTHCYYCFTRVKSCVPCDDCNVVRYCNETCRQKAWQEYHNMECGLVSRIISTDNCWGHLAHRLVVKLGPDNLVKFHKYLSTEGASVNWTKFGANSGEIINSTDYKCVHALVTHAQDRELSDLFFRTVKAVYLIKCLEQSVFFTGIENLLEFTGGLMLSNLQLCPCNAHEVSELHVMKSDIEKTKSCEIGAGLYPTLSLFNHSCDPNVVRYFYGDVCVTRAIHHIPKGGEIVDNYGALYPTLTRQDRRQTLSSQYFFTCTCLPCKHDWPLYKDMIEGEDSPPVLRCDRCGEPLMPQETAELKEFACAGCGYKHNILQRMAALDQSHDEFAQALSGVLRGEPASVRALENHLDLMDRLLHLPWKMFNNAQEALKHHYGIKANCFTLP